MEQEKINNINNSDTSSTAESDHHNQPEKPKEGSAAARSYDCTFCKRGFTNAQALGGHMNIHRTKAKKKNREEDPMIQTFDSSFLPQIAAAGYGWGGRHANYQVYIPPPNPGLQTGNYEYCFFPDWRQDNLQDRMIHGNLRSDEDEGEDEEEVDLELRLGRLF